MKTNYSSKSLYFAPTILLLISIVIFQCGPKPKAGISADTPFDLSVVTGDRNATLYWHVNRTDKPTGGYNIYLADKADEPGRLYNSGAYPGDTDGDNSVESIELERLVNGRQYYAWVKTISPDGVESKPSEAISFMPLAQGHIRISMNQTAPISGFSFADNDHTIVRDFTNDLYISQIDGRPIIGSPSRIHPSLRVTKIYDTSDSTAEALYYRYLTEGKIYRLQTADNGNAFLTFTGMRGTGSNSQAKFDYIYYPPGVAYK